jgi:Metallo-beta-lactamase superfamily
MFSPVRRDVFRWGTPDPEGDWIMFGHLFVRESGIVLVDPPLIPSLIESINRIGKPEAIILTSQNHARGSKFIREKTGATIYVPDQDPKAVEPQDAQAVKEIGQFEKYSTGKLLGFEVFKDFFDFALLTDHKEILIADNATGSPDGRLLVYPEYVAHDPPHPPNETVLREFKNLVKKTEAVTLLAGHGYNIYGNLQDLADRK